MNDGESRRYYSGAFEQVCLHESITRLTICRLNRARDDCQTIEDSLTELQKFHLCREFFVTMDYKEIYFLVGQITDNSHFVMIESALQSLNMGQLRAEVSSLRSRCKLLTLFFVQISFSVFDMLKGYHALVEKSPKILEEKSDFFELVNRFRLIRSVTQSLKDAIDIVDAAQSENDNEADNINSEAIKINEDLSLLEEEKDQFVRENAVYDDVQELEEEQKLLRENLEIHREELSNIIDELHVATTEYEQIGRCSDEIFSSDTAHDEHVIALIEEAGKEYDVAIAKMHSDLKEVEVKVKNVTLHN